MASEKCAQDPPPFVAWKEANKKTSKTFRERYRKRHRAIKSSLEEGQETHQAYPKCMHIILLPGPHTAPRPSAFCSGSRWQPLRSQRHTSNRFCSASPALRPTHAHQTETSAGSVTGRPREKKKKRCTRTWNTLRALACACLNPTQPRPIQSYPTPPHRIESIDLTRRRSLIDGNRPVSHTRSRTPSPLHD